MDASRFTLACLDPLTTDADVERAASRAAEEGLAGVRVWPAHVKTARRASVEAGARSGRRPLVRACASHPFGAVTTMMRSIEATQCAKAGADEIEVSPPPPALLSGDTGEVVDALLLGVKSMRSVLGSIRILVCVQTPLLRALGVGDEAVDRAIRTALEGARACGCEGVSLGVPAPGLGEATPADASGARAAADGARLAAGGLGDDDATGGAAILDAGADEASIRFRRLRD